MAFLNLDGAETPHGRNSVKKKKANNGLYIKITVCLHRYHNMSRTSKLQHTEPRRAEPLTA